MSTQTATSDKVIEKDIHYYMNVPRTGGQANPSCEWESLQPFQQLRDQDLEGDIEALKAAFILSLGGEDIDGKGFQFKLPDEYPPIWRELRDGSSGDYDAFEGLWTSKIRSDIVDGHLFFRQKDLRHDHVARTIRDEIRDGLRRIRKAQSDSDTVEFIDYILSDGEGASYPLALENDWMCPSESFIFERWSGDFPGLPSIIIDVAVGESGQRELDKKINAYFAKNERNMNLLIVIEVNENSPSLITVAIPYSVRDHERILSRKNLEDLTTKLLQIRLDNFVANVRGNEEGFRRWRKLKRHLTFTVSLERILNACRCPLSEIVLAPEKSLSEASRSFERRLSLMPGGNIDRSGTVENYGASVQLIERE